MRSPRRPGERARPLLDLGRANAIAASHSRSSVDGLGLDDDVVRPRVERRRIARRACTRGWRARSPPRGAGARTSRCTLPAVARGAAGARRLERPHAEGRHVASCDRSAPARRRDGVRRARRLEHPGAHEARLAHRGQHGQRGARRAPRASRSRWLARSEAGPAPAGRPRRRSRRTRRSLDLGDQARGACRGAHGLDERVALEAAGHGLGHARRRAPRARRRSGSASSMCCPSSPIAKRANPRSATRR